LADALLACSPFAAQASPAGDAQPSASLPTQSAEKELRHFYEIRGDRPLWTTDGALTPAAETVVSLIRTAELDGISSEDVYLADLDLALRRLNAAPSPKATREADLALSRSFAAYVRKTLEAPQGLMLYEHASLEPQVPTVLQALQSAAAAPSLASYVAQIGWLHPLYAPLRQAIAAQGRDDTALRRRGLANLERIRALPTTPRGGRYVLVNAARAQLWMYEGDRAIGSMKVVVGKVDHQTPMMAGYIRYAILNPYWNVPADFTRDKIAGNVISKGPSYLRGGGYEVLSDWTADATVVDPQTVDWRAVANGQVNLRVRQKPGPANSMGKVKYEFPNQLGIYLHDTPQTALMLEQQRLYSSGCVRLEDAERLGRWLFGGPMPVASQTEERFDLPAIVPVYITYLTLEPGPDGQLAVSGDAYGRDRPAQPALAIEGGRSAASR